MQVYKKEEGILTVPTDWSIFLVYNFGDSDFNGGTIKIRTWAERYISKDKPYITKLWSPTSTFYSEE
jgi:hypothetical protein